MLLTLPTPQDHLSNEEDEGAVAAAAAELQGSVSGANLSAACSVLGDAERYAMFKPEGPGALLFQVLLLLSPEECMYFPKITS